MSSSNFELALPQDILEQARQEVQKQKKQAYEEGLEEGRLEHTEKIMETVLSSVEFIEGIESQLVYQVNYIFKINPCKIKYTDL